MRFIVAIISGKTELAIFVIFELQFVERCVMVIDSKDKTHLIEKRAIFVRFHIDQSAFNKTDSIRWKRLVNIESLSQRTVWFKEWKGDYGWT